jgi:hypothetical protein
MTTTCAIIFLWHIDYSIPLILKRSSSRPNRYPDINSENRITTGARLLHSHPGEPCEPSANASA